MHENFLFVSSSTSRMMFFGCGSICGLFYRFGGCCVDFSCFFWWDFWGHENFEFVDDEILILTFGTWLWCVGKFKLWGILFVKRKLG